MNKLHEAIDNAYIQSSMHISSEPFNAPNIIINRKQATELILDAVIEALPPTLDYTELDYKDVVKQLLKDAKEDNNGN